MIKNKLVIKLILPPTVKYMMTSEFVFYVIVITVFSSNKEPEKVKNKLKENGLVSKILSELDTVTNIMTKKNVLPVNGPKTIDSMDYHKI